LVETFKSSKLRWPICGASCVSSLRGLILVHRFRSLPQRHTHASWQCQWWMKTLCIVLGTIQGDTETKINKNVAWISNIFKHTRVQERQPEDCRRRQKTYVNHSVNRKHELNVRIIWQYSTMTNKSDPHAFSEVFQSSPGTWH
jgi:hypothetical protein